MPPVHVTSGITAPLFTYKHTAAAPPGSGPGGFLVGSAVVGGAFYPASGNFPAAYRNSYFFADYPLHWVARLDTANPGDVYGFIRNVNGSPVGLLVGIDGALYVLKLEGSIMRVSVP